MCRFAAVFPAVALGLCLPLHADPPPAPRTTHPLMPGVRSPELWNAAWPRTLHDKQITGFSPLACGMRTAPRVWATVDVGGEVNWTRVLRLADGQEALLVNDGRLRLLGPDGTLHWTNGEWGSLLWCGDLRGNGTDYLLLGAGPRLSVVNIATGKTDWVHIFDPPYVYVRAAVGRVLPDRPGMDAAVFFQYGEDGCLLHFPPQGEPQVVWQRKVVEPGEHPERADHGCDVRLDFSVPDQPLIWNVRHHRCRGFNARTGEVVSSLVYDIAGGHRRNYGPWALGVGKSGQPLICVTAEAIHLHVHAIKLNRKGPSHLAWEHYYGEVYEVPGVALKNIAMSDVDGDGATEMVYNVRDPAAGFRSFVRVRDAETGAVKAELPDSWCAGAALGLGPDKANCLLVHKAPGGATPEVGPLTVYRFEKTGALSPLASFPRARLWGPATMPGTSGNDVVLRLSEKGKPILRRFTVAGGKLKDLGATSAAALLAAPIQAVLGKPGGAQTLAVADAEGNLSGVTWEGRAVWSLPLSGGPVPTLAAADLNGDGRAELVAACPGHRVRVFIPDAGGHFRELFNREFLGTTYRLSPLLYDLEGNGKLCLVAPGSTEDGFLAARAYRADGSLLWETPLDMPTANGGNAVAWNAGQFLPGPRAAVAISVGDAERIREGTCLLDGPTGKLLWKRDLYRDGSALRGFIPCGVPTAFDWDGDGVEELVMDLYSYLAVIRGADGSIAYVRHTANISADKALFAAMLYNSFCPLYRTPQDTKPYWFSPLGFGRFGLMDPEPSTGPWVEDVGYDVPQKVGLVDVDGDGVLEAGYAVANSPIFKCRDVWTGRVKWELKLPSPVYGPVITADVDGDGKGEFLGGNYCIGTNAQGQGEVRWVSPVPLQWAIIADFDGDGKGEIACPGSGRITILKGTQ